MSTYYRHNPEFSIIPSGSSSFALMLWKNHSTNRPSTDTMALCAVASNLTHDWTLYRNKQTRCFAYRVCPAKV
ncbi:hypothetical protein OUZ56_019890 [Daphnia magna]|uniref:Uncharacterized protein n=1 Tax=Daphnia magna TaxID=35525 RepID=A0ABQ9ZCX0_9CRUS|nr:hypothetical protein OUZ56_019890 [Daphnia magna]